MRSERADLGPMDGIFAGERGDLIQLRWEGLECVAIWLEILLVVRQQEAALARLGVLRAGQQLVQRSYNLVRLRNFLIAFAQILQVDVRDNATNQEKDDSDR